MMVKQSLVLYLLIVMVGCATSSPIQRYAESQSAFDDPPALISHSYPGKDIYRIYHRASTGFVSIQSIRKAAEQRAEDFARRQSKSIVVLGEQTSQPPYILGNFPRIEIVFALVDLPNKKSQTTIRGDKYSEIEKLKKLLDQGALTRDEFEREKAKLLQ